MLQEEAKRLVGREVKILTALSPAKLAECVEGNMVEWIQLKGRLPNVELHRDSDVLWTFSSTNGSVNHVCALRFKPETVDPALVSSSTTTNGIAQQ